MPRHRTTSFPSTRAVTLIGHNAQIVHMATLFAEGGVTVTVFTSDENIEDQLVMFPGVEVHLVPQGYRSAPENLSGAPYFVGIDRRESALRVKSWLPKTRAIFLLGAETSRRKPPAGFLSIAPLAHQTRRRLQRRLSTLKRVDTLLSMASTAQQPLILLYGDPDPDAIGAAYGLTALWSQAGSAHPPLIRYTGDIQRYQNRLLISYLDENIERLREVDLEYSDLIAVVDAQPGFWAKDPPLADVIIDHHPRKEGTAARFCDIRERAGSTSTILTEYLTEAEIPIGKKLATALLYGLTTDTNDLQRNTHDADIKAYDILHGRSDRHFLTRLSYARIPMNMLDYIAWGLRHRIVVRDMMIIHFGEVPTPDVMVQTADQALQTCGINWVVCAGKKDDALTVIFRGDGHRQDVGARAAKAFAKLGSAGGHRTMGRAEIPLHGEHVDATVEVLVENLFKRMSSKRRTEIIRRMRNSLHGEHPSNQVDTWSV